MKVVLKENIRGLGNVGDVVSVKDGYARNFLFPRGIATAPTEDVISALRKERLRYLDQESDQIAAAKHLRESIGELMLEIEMKANEAGQLFGSVTEAIVAERLSAQLERSFTKEQIIIGSHFKRIGDYLATVRLHSEVEMEIGLHVVAEETEEEREERLAAEEAAREAAEAVEAELDAEEAAMADGEPIEG
ncbi:MAG: 50S ribosomal protein L9 [Planctomycetota bacterium]